ncbi:MAG TPA: DASS family sodium-coupled anion symporter [Dehalococcoidia bacterium]|nr:DASS family sodium-coupled anion symporter [Dehalococcoidia bacterium]
MDVTPQRANLLSTLGLVSGPLAALAVALMPLPGLSREAHTLAGILTLVVVYWVTEALPLPVTALLGVTLAVLLGVADATTAFSALGNEVVFLFIGSFMLARAMSVHGLDRRVAYALLSFPLAEGSPLLMMLLLGGVAAGVSMWVSNTATAAMLLPVALAIGQHASTTPAGPAQGTLQGAPPSPYAVALLFMLAYGASIGGMATPVGTPPNLIGIALIRETTGRDLTFFQWVQIGLPLALVLLLVAFALLVWLYRPPLRRPPPQPGYFRRQLRALGRVTPGERNTALALGAAACLWMLPGAVALAVGQDSPLYRVLQERLPEGAVALAAAGLLFLLPVGAKPRRPTLTWEQAAAIDWGTVLLFAGGIALGKMMLDTTLAGSLGAALAAGTGLSSQTGITAAAVAAGVLISEAASNTASANIVIPVMASIANAAGVSGVVPALGATLGASLGFMLPVSTPPNALIYGTRQLTILQMVRTGLLLDLLGAVALWAYLSYLLPLWFT